MSRAYIKHELAQVKPSDGDIIRVKFVGEGETRWLNISADQYETIKTVLVPEALTESEGGDHD